MSLLFMRTVQAKLFIHLQWVYVYNLLACSIHLVSLNTVLHCQHRHLWHAHPLGSDWNVIMSGSTDWQADLMRYLPLKSATYHMQSTGFSLIRKEKYLTIYMPHKPCFHGLWLWLVVNFLFTPPLENMSQNEHGKIHLIMLHLVVPSWKTNPCVQGVHLITVSFILNIYTTFFT